MWYWTPCFYTRVTYDLSISHLYMSNLLQELQHVDNEFVRTQVNVFLEHKGDDSEEFGHRYDNVRCEMEYPFINLFPACPLNYDLALIYYTTHCCGWLEYCTISPSCVKRVEILSIWLCSFTISLNLGNVLTWYTTRHSTQWLSHSSSPYYSICSSSETTPSPGTVYTITSIYLNMDV